MITLYTCATPNGHKASILLEELGLSYKVQKFDLMADEHLQPEYRAVSPAGKLPAVVEDLPGGRKRRLFGSGAILLHYAERTKRLMPEATEDRAEAMSWLMLGISDLAPSAAHLFRFGVRAPEKIPYAIDYFKAELARCYDAMAARLDEVEFLAGSYSVADLACFPFVAVSAAADATMLQRYPSLKRWYDILSERPAVKRGMAVPE